MIRLAVVLAVTVVPLPALAQEAEAPQSESAPPPVEPAPDAENIVVKGKKICERRVETGSIVPRRVCRSPEEVAAEQERSQRLLDRLRTEQNTRRHTEESRRQGL
jgi:hypothetical protein